MLFFFFQAEDGIRDYKVTGVQTCALPIFACITAAGNSGGPLAFPAMLPGVMAVAAVGKLREFPADSSHVLSVIPQLIGGDGGFSGGFRAPGAPGGGFAPRGGGGVAGPRGGR